jgi:hypothetical protein
VRNGVRVAKQARIVPPFSPSGPVRGSISDVISNSPVISSTPKGAAWEAVNRQNATQIASPSLTKGEETFAQLAKNVLLEHPEGRTSEQISVVVHATGLKGNDLNVIKPNVSAALSSHSRGDKAIFRKGHQNEERKQIWHLKDTNNSPLMTDESLERIFAPSEPDTTVGVDALQEHESGERYNTTSDRVSVHETESAEENPETNEDGATTLPDTISVGIAQMINNVIASAGQSPPTGESDGPAAALAVEPSEHPQPHELQRACPPLVDRLGAASALDPQPSVHESGPAISTPYPSPVLVMEDGLVSAPQCIAVEREPTESVAGELQTDLAVQDISLERTLPVHLTAMIGKHVENFSDCHKQQPLVFQKYLSSCDRSDGDAQAAFKDIIAKQLRANMTLDSTVPQPVSTFHDAQQALDDIRRVRAMEGHIDVAIKDCNIVQAAMEAEIDRLKQVVADLDSSARSLQETKAQAVASREFSRERINAFIGDQDNNGQNID